LKTCIAIGIVLARPDKNSDQPRVLRFGPLNLSASNNPAPNPIAPRVAAIRAISGTVRVFGSDGMVIFTPIGFRINDITTDKQRAVFLLLARARLTCHVVGVCTNCFRKELGIVGI
jgi:hypothetical protein